MDNFEFGMFGECDDYNAREEFAREQEADEGWDPIMGTDEDWVETDDDFAADYYGEEEFA